MANRYRSYFFSTVLVLCFKLVCEAQETNVVEGWKYIPLDSEFASQAESLREAKNLAGLANFAFLRFSDGKRPGGESLEGKLFLAQALRDLGLPALAGEYFKEIVRDHPGTFMAQQSLVDLSELLTRTPFHWTSVQDLFNRGAFKDIPQGALSMIHFFVSLDNMKKKEMKWVQANLDRIEATSFWGQRLEYFKGLEWVKKGEFSRGEEVFRNLSGKESTATAIKQDSILQRARLLFELKRYDEAEAEYLKVESRGRETGRVLFERALVAYRQKKFAHALGLLESLKSANFKTAFHPDHIILEMLIYRDLCHYPTVRKIAAEYEKRYAFLLNFLKSGQSLLKSQVVKRMALQRGSLRPLADLINEMRIEQREIKDNLGDLSSKLSEKLRLDLQMYELRYFENSEIDLAQPLRLAANEFFAKSEEIRLLEYVSGLDEFRIKNIFESRTFKGAGDKEDRAKNYEILYWPIQEEYWLDEFKNYQVILTDRCSGTALKKEMKK